MKRRIAMFLAFLAVGGLIVGPLVVPKSMMPGWLRLLSETLAWFDAATFALMVLAVCVFLAIVKFRVGRERKKLAASGDSDDDEPRCDVQVLDSRSEEIARIQELFGAAAKIVDGEQQR